MELGLLVLICTIVLVARSYTTAEFAERLMERFGLFWKTLNRLGVHTLKVRTATKLKAARWPCLELEFDLRWGVGEFTIKRPHPERFQTAKAETHPPPPPIPTSIKTLWIVTI